MTEQVIPEQNAALSVPPRSLGMDHVVLGTTGLPVSRFCLGSATFGGQCDERASFAILDRAEELGIRFLDTADKYPIGSRWDSAGISEAIIGRWLTGRREHFVLASKVHGPTGPMPFDSGLNRRHILTAIDATLRRLGTDYLDLYQLHRPDPATPIEETLEVLTGIVQAGKVRYVGCSNFLAYQVARALGKSDANHFVRFRSVQPRYNLLFREHERELLPLCQEEGLAVLTYNALAGGMLAGKHKRDGSNTVDTRFDLPGAGQLYRCRYWHDGAFNAVDQLSAAAAEAGLSLPVMSVAWLLAQPAVTSVILGASRPEHIDIAASAAQVTLEEDLLARVDQITRRFRTGDAVQ